MQSGRQLFRGYESNPARQQIIWKRSILQNPQWSTYLDESSGSQTIIIESFHSGWRYPIRARVRTAPTDVCQTMQQHFAEDWCDKFAWEENKAVLTWPESPAPALLNGQPLRTAGRSPAIDFWTAREKRLCGSRNHCKAFRHTGAQDSADRSCVQPGLAS